MEKKLSVKDVFYGYYFSTGKLSDISRYLGYSGIGAVILIWSSNSGFVKLHSSFAYFTLIFLIASVIFDFIQYLFLSFRWKKISTKVENEGLSGQDDKIINIPHSCLDCWVDIFFWGKINFVILGVFGVLIIYFKFLNSPP